MPDGALTNSKIVAAYREKTPSSSSRATQAREVFPSGLVHDSRKLDPYPIYVDHAQGAHKWDIDGNEYVDYFGGHGALILGHNHPTVLAAVHAQLDKGTHFGACHELEVRWGELVKQLVPCAERVRFTSSGTEANLMALRLARAFTGKSKLVRFKGHFHGWQDHVAFGVTSHFDGTPTPGIVDGIAENVLLAPPDDIEATRRIFEAHDDIAAVMLEPTGASFGQVPVTREFVAELRKIATEHGVILIFDEVVTGFRVAPGGAQEHYGVTPDMCSLAKILAGGLPGGAITGRADIMEL
ncbi:MAG: aminotransferase class III-fold pyridoxal phosphate-dependent enzyme, partial [Rhodospirillaceae bacterium]|nr:aminotransferase class III-fold pyridoxal phosphate-dependent enzyme [Rhodospirillaceae bacterium]